MIKNLIFDVGGIIMNIDYQLTIDAFKKLGAKNLDAEYLKPQTDNQLDLIDKFEIGKISAHDFRCKIKTLICAPLISDEQFDNAWNAMMINLIRENFEFIKLLKNKSTYKLYVFSNINEIHYKRAFEIVYRDIQCNNFNDVFNKEYYSHLCGFRKPYKESFVKILIENNLQPENTLFIDDSPVNIDGAKKAGLQALLINNNDMVQNVSAIISSYL